MSNITNEKAQAVLSALNNHSCMIKCRDCKLMFGPCNVPQNYGNINENDCVDIQRNNLKKIIGEYECPLPQNAGTIDGSGNLTAEMVEEFIEAYDRIKKEKPQKDIALLKTNLGFDLLAIPSEHSEYCAKSVKIIIQLKENHYE